MRRVIAAVAAVLLAALGAVLLVNYVNRADERALEGLETQTVLVASELISAGTTAEAAAGLIDAETLPNLAVVPGALSSLDEVAGQVTAVDLQPGEQVVAARFVNPESLTAPDAIAVPDGLQEVSILLEPQRVIGGRLAAGQTIGVLLSYQPPVLPYETKVVLNRVLVTRVVGAPTAAADPDNPEAGPGVPSQSLMVSLAINTPDVERLVHGAEHGTVWLTLQPDAANLDGSRIVTPGNIYE